jgi:DNA/RNA endonuclease YhcR with UshA esterase domain
MRRRVGIIFVLVLVLSGVEGFPAFPQENTSAASHAGKFVGQKATVCGTVASSKYASGSKRQPTFLNLGQSYPHQIFTAVIWGSDRDKFSGPPENIYRDKEICVTGLVELYRGKPEIIVRNPAQIAVKNRIDSNEK